MDHHRSVWAICKDNFGIIKNMLGVEEKLLVQEENPLNVFN